MVPDGWKILTLGEICQGNLQTGPFGSQLHSHEYVDGSGVPVLMPKDLNNTKADLQTAAKISVQKAEKLKKHKLKSGDIIFSRRGDVTRFALIDEYSEGALCGTGCLKATPSTKHSSQFIALFLQKNAVKKWLEQNAVGQTMPNMNTAILSELPLLTASSKDEEMKIAKILLTWDKAITTTEKLLANSEQQKKALMQQLLTGKKRFPTDVSSWRDYALSEIFEFKKGKGLSKGVIACTGKKKCILYGELYTKYNEVIKAVFSRTHSNDGFPSKYGDVLVPCSTTTSGIDLAKATALFENDVLLGGDINVLRPKISVDSAFISYLLTHVKKNEIASRAQGITIIHLYGSDLKSLNVTIPASLSDQQKIASVFSTADQEIEKLKQKLDCLKQEKKALMQQLLTGKRRVKVAEISDD